ncbi:Hypothetical predicted protein, partial [Podarcis lilfordi]
QVVAVATAAACGLAGNSVFFSTVPLRKQQQQVVVGKSSSDAPVPLPPFMAPPPGLLLLSSPANATSYPAMAPGWLKKPNCVYWDDSWD